MRKLTLALAFILITGPAAGQSAAEQRLWDQYERAMRREAEALREHEAWRLRWEESLDKPKEPGTKTDHLRQPPNLGSPPARRLPFKSPSGGD